MKKVFLLIFLPLISGYVFAQSKQPSSNLMDNIRGKIEHTTIKTTNFCSGMNLEQAIKPQTPNQPSLIQIFDSVYNWRWDTLGIEWKIFSKYTNMVYDAKHNLISYIEQNWNGSTWLNYAKYLFTYDPNNNQTSELDQSWNGGAWVNSDQYIFTYDANNNQTSELDQSWNGSVWVNSSQYIFTYDANNNQTNELKQGWDGSVWANSWQHNYTYATNNNLLSDIYQTWNGSDWVNSYQQINTYDSKNNLINELGQSWNGSTWVDARKYTYTYDVYNNRTYGLSQEWYNNAWVNSSQYIYTYDFNNNQTSELSQSWKGNVWLNSWLYLFTYDANNLTKSFSYKDWNNSGTKIFSGDSNYYYYHTVLGINDLIGQEGSIHVYPNPSTTQITIETSTTSTKSQLSIMNFNGQQLITRQIIHPKTQIDISTLPNGVYFVRLTNERTVEVGKFIKQ